MKTFTQISYNVIPDGDDISNQPLSENKKLETEINTRLCHLSGCLDILRRCVDKRSPDEIGDEFWASIHSTIDLASSLADSLIGATDNLTSKLQNVSPDWKN